MDKRPQIQFTESPDYFTSIVVPIAVITLCVAAVMLFVEYFGQ